MATKRSPGRTTRESAMTRETSGGAPSAWRKTSASGRTERTSIRFTETELRNSSPRGRECPGRRAPFPRVEARPGGPDAADRLRADPATPRNPSPSSAARHRDARKERAPFWRRGPWHRAHACALLPTMARSVLLRDSIEAPTWLDAARPAERPPDRLARRQKRERSAADVALPERSAECLTPEKQSVKKRDRPLRLHSTCPAALPSRRR